MMTPVYWFLVVISTLISVSSSSRVIHDEMTYSVPMGFADTHPLKDLGRHVSSFAELMSTALVQPLTYLTQASDGLPIRREHARQTKQQQQQQQQGEGGGVVEMNDNDNNNNNGVLNVFTGRRQQKRGKHGRHEAEETDKRLHELQTQHLASRAHRRAMSTLAAGEQQIDACEGESRTFSCADGVIQVQEGFWGRLQGNLCPSDSVTDTSCSLSSAKQVLAGLCNGKRSCSVRASNAFFNGDPCVGTNKYMQVSFDCVDPALFNATSSGNASDTFGRFNYDRESYGKVYSCAPTYVDGGLIVAEGSKGVLTSHFDVSRGYGEEWECNFLIRPKGADVDANKEDFVVLLAFDYLDTRSASTPREEFECRECGCDYIEVFDAGSADPRYRLGSASSDPDDSVFPMSGSRVCGEYDAGTSALAFVSTGREMFLRFRSDVANGAQGFRAAYSVLPLPKNSVRFARTLSFSEFPSAANVSVDSPAVVCSGCSGQKAKRAFVSTDDVSNFGDVWNFTREGVFLTGGLNYSVVNNRNARFNETNPEHPTHLREVVSTTVAGLNLTARKVPGLFQWMIDSTSSNLDVFRSSQAFALQDESNWPAGWEDWPLHPENKAVTNNGGFHVDTRALTFGFDMAVSVVLPQAAEVKFASDFTRDGINVMEHSRQGDGATVEVVVECHHCQDVLVRAYIHPQPAAYGRLPASFKLSRSDLLAHGWSGDIELPEHGTGVSFPKGMAADADGIKRRTVRITTKTDADFRGRYGFWMELSRDPCPRRVGWRNDEPECDRLDKSFELRFPLNSGVAVDFGERLFVDVSFADFCGYGKRVQVQREMFLCEDARVGAGAVAAADNNTVATGNATICENLFPRFTTEWFAYSADPVRLDANLPLESTCALVLNVTANLTVTGRGAKGILAVIDAAVSEASNEELTGVREEALAEYDSLALALQALRADCANWTVWNCTGGCYSHVDVTSACACPFDRKGPFCDVRRAVECRYELVTGLSDLAPASAAIAEQHESALVGQPPLFEVGQDGSIAAGMLELDVAVTCAFAGEENVREGVSAGQQGKLETEGYVVDSAFNTTYANGSRVFTYVVEQAGNSNFALSALDPDTTTGDGIQIRVGVADFMRIGKYKETIIDLPNAVLARAPNAKLTKKNTVNVNVNVSGAGNQAGGRVYLEIDVAGGISSLVQRRGSVLVEVAGWRPRPRPSTTVSTTTLIIIFSVLGAIALAIAVYVYNTRQEQRTREFFQEEDAIRKERMRSRLET